ncbi:hypothetical protein, partial [Hymenobacter agri]
MLALLLLLAAAPASVFAQVPGGAPATSAPAAASAAATQTPVAAAAPFSVEATHAYLNTLTPAQKAKSDAYFEGGYWLQLVDLLYGLAVAVVFLRLGLGRWLQARTQRL